MWVRSFAPSTAPMYTSQMNANRLSSSDQVRDALSTNRKNTCAPRQDAMSAMRKAQKYCSRSR